MNNYEWAIYDWFVKTADTLENMKKLCKKHFDTEDVDILLSDPNKIIEMYEKEKSK